MKEYDLSEIDVLIVEFHPNMRSLMRRVLRELGIVKIRDTSDPEMAFDMVQKAPCDLILTDWSPGVDGINFMTRIRNAPDSPDPYMPIIVVTANTEMSHVCIARDNGMTEFLAKPISASLIYNRIRSVIERKRVFVRNDNFFGPDRRRRLIEVNHDDRRQNVVQTTSPAVIDGSEQARAENRA